MTELIFTSRTKHLALTPLFQQHDHKLSFEEQCELSYKRARVIAREYGLTIDDIVNLSPNFFEMHQDNFSALDGALITFLTIQYNLIVGSLAPFAVKKPELGLLLQQLLKFDVCGHFLMTEVGHGLNAFNLETTATLLPNGDFDLHSPTDGSAKIMPPTTPLGGIPHVGLVFARLVIDNEDRGLKRFVVALGNGKEMCKGVTCRLLPALRVGTGAVDHAITSFDHVRLPPVALLDSPDKPANAHLSYLSMLWRINIGSFGLSLAAIPGLAVSAYIAAKYSLRRTVGDPKGNIIPIWSFRTQHLPILHALAQVYVFKALAGEMAGLYRDPQLDWRVRMAIPATVKVVIISGMPKLLASLGERCGAQGLYAHNQIMTKELEIRGIAIAEGDILMLSIRLATELLIGRYEMPKSRHPDCLLSRHEAALFARCQSKVAEVGDHRGEAFNRWILPLCLPLVQAIGHRMAYEAALDAKLDQHQLDLYEAYAMKADPAWYSEFAGIGWWNQHEREENAATAAIPFFERDIEGLDVEAFAVAPILSDEKWRTFIENLHHFPSGSEELDLFAAPCSQPEH